MYQDVSSGLRWHVTTYVYLAVICCLWNGHCNFYTQCCHCWGGLVCCTWWHVRELEHCSCWENHLHVFFQSFLKRVQQSDHLCWYNSLLYIYTIYTIYIHYIYIYYRYIYILYIHIYYIYNIDVYYLSPFTEGSNTFPTQPSGSSDWERILTAQRRGAVACRTPLGKSGWPLPSSTTAW